MFRRELDSSGLFCRFVLQPNRSASWRGVVVFYSATCAFVLTVALFFTVQGLYFVLPFAGVELLALGVALYITSLRLYRREVITVDKESVVVEKGRRHLEKSWTFQRLWARVKLKPACQSPQREILTVGSHGLEVEVGNFLSNGEKAQLARQLRRVFSVTNSLH